MLTGVQVGAHWRAGDTDFKQHQDLAVGSLPYPRMHRHALHLGTAPDNDSVRISRQLKVSQHLPRSFSHQLLGLADSLIKFI